MAVMIPFMVIVFLGLCTPARACEPIVPLFQVFSGTLLGVDSLFALMGVVVVKMVAFTVFEKKISHQKAALFMFFANIFSTFLGIVLATIVSTPAYDSGIMICIMIYFLAIMPAKRLVKHDPWGCFRRWNPWVLAVAILAMFIVTFFLFGASQSILNSGDSTLRYWLVKFLYIYVAITLSFGLTSIWEEWAIAKLAKSLEAPYSYLMSVFKANAIAFILVMIHPATTTLAIRLKTNSLLVW